MPIFLKTSLCLLLSFSFFHHSVASVGSTGAPRQGIIGTMEMLEEMDREQAQKEIHEVLDKKELKELLLKNGLDQKEVSARVASLSDSELLSLQTEIKEAKAGGILTTILVVILIIYFAQRI